MLPIFSHLFFWLACRAAGANFLHVTKRARVVRQYIVYWNSSQAPPHLDLGLGHLNWDTSSGARDTSTCDTSTEGRRPMCPKSVEVSQDRIFKKREKIHRRGPSRGDAASRRRRRRRPPAPQQAPPHVCVRLGALSGWPGRAQGAGTCGKASLPCSIAAERRTQKACMGKPMTL